MIKDKLMKASLWAKREFEECSIPDNRTVKRWIENGTIKGRIIDGASWVYASEQMGVESNISAVVRQLLQE